MKAVYAIAAAACLPMVAQAGPVTPSEVEMVLEDYGATVASSQGVGENAHVINAKLDDLAMYVRLDECDSFDECGLVVLFTAFEIEDEIDAETLQKTNRYNDSYPIGRAFVYPSEAGGNMIGIDYVIDVSGESVIDSGDLQRFERAVRAYVDHWTSNES
ncbi:MAG: hypothetical protein RIB03_00200 [Henriciella sp.]|uniref:YbjN domain-containing protein n=1 Tax=Henriciella sp. TaxID=1968823 RepID=UPI00260187E1|nr:YbjN domain-containing protein [Henriciella sp.]